MDKYKRIPIRQKTLNKIKEISKSLPDKEQKFINHRVYSSAYLLKHLFMENITHIDKII